MSANLFACKSFSSPNAYPQTGTTGASNRFYFSSAAKLYPSPQSCRWWNGGKINCTNIASRLMNGRRQVWGYLRWNQPKTVALLIPCSVVVWVMMVIIFHFIHPFNGLGCRWQCRTRKESCNSSGMSYWKGDIAYSLVGDYCPPASCLLRFSEEG